MYNDIKSNEKNAWTSSTTASLNSCTHCNCGKNKKSSTNNDWTSTSKNGDSGCGCK